MTEDRKRAEDVYELVVKLGQRMDNINNSHLAAGGDIEILARIQEHEQLMITVPIMEGTIDALADHVIGEKILDPLRPDEFLINGQGQPMRKPRRRWPAWVGQAIVQSLGVATALLIFLAATS